MSIEEVKDQLPDVAVKLMDGEIVFARVRGRNNAFARVYIPTLPVFVEFECAWATIARCITNNTPIIY